MNDEGLEILGNAVVLQAVKDYRRACKTMQNNKPLSDKYKNAKYVKEECERFFLSQRFNIFSRADGTAILEILRKEQENAESKRRKK